jgi:hypothetical protein
MTIAQATDLRPWAFNHQNQKLGTGNSKLETKSERREPLID